MVRISVVEQYDNKDVIQQVYSLKGRMDTLEDSLDEANANASEALANSQQAQQTADIANAGVNNLNPRVDTLEQDMANVEEAVETAQNDVDVSVTTGSIVTTATTAQLKLIRNNSSENTTDVPLASGSVTGMMTAQTYNGLVQLQDRVSALEASQNVYYVVFASSTPSQEEITTAFTTASGRAPQAGDYCTDIAKALTYGYNGTTWIKVESGQIPTFTNESAGLVKGNGTEAGTVFAEADGTGSVNGWDALNNALDTVEGYVGTPQDFASSTGSLYARVADLVADVTQNTSDIATKQDDLTPVTVTLTVAGWSNNQQSQSAVNVTADNIVWVSPTPASFDAYTEAGIRAIAQGAGTITFQCTTVPTVEITVEVVA